MRRAARTDGPHKEIMLGLRAYGASVLDLSRVGNGAPDLLVGFRGVTYLIEVKGEASVKKFPPNGLSAQQEAFFRAWNGKTPKVVYTLDEAIALISDQGAM